MKNLMILGAGNCQLNAIKRIRELGFRAVVSDNRLDSPGKRMADVSVLADTFSYEQTYKSAVTEAVDGIMTSGTDQPVLTVNKVASTLGLPQLLDVETALWVTDKSHMKRLFTKHGIPTAPYALCKADFKDEALDHIEPPYVIKPVDSQGQRGIYKVNSLEEIRSRLKDVLSYSRSDEILVESYYENDEITVTGWVERGALHVLTVTDRVTFGSDSHIGVCLAHEYPSRQLNTHRDDIMALTEKLCEVFHIESGPIYFQYLVGAKGVLVNEIACRIGGAYEDIFVPLVTDVPLLDLTILSSVEPEGDRLNGLKEVFDHYVYSEKGARVSVQLFFCKEGSVSALTERSALLELPYVVDMCYNIKVGEVIPSIENASQRAGYAILQAQDEDALQACIEKFYETMQVLDDRGNNLVMKQKRIYRD
ncbi:MAG: ATP-grasp domain-containing protein [Clostridia bacterium]|nr:ATP-grasp domain-containing protein [Clostridia bacterium]